jgi:uncharacterized cupin superfamily protein
VVPAPRRRPGARIDTILITRVDEEEPMSDESRPSPLLKVEDRPTAGVVNHPLNPSSEMHWQSLSDAVGLSRIGVHVIRLPPGKESCVYHTHAAEEEWIYILSGRAIAEIDGNEHEVGPGDFMGFPTPSVAHHLRNAGDEEVVYLVGGERKDLEIAEFPHLGKMVVRVGRTADMVDRAHLERLWPPAGPDDVQEA